MDVCGNTCVYVKVSDTGERAREQVVFEDIRMTQKGDRIISEEIAKEQVKPLVQVEILIW